MKFGINVVRSCGSCKFYVDAPHGHGEPTGTCRLKKHLYDLFQSFGIKADLWLQTTGCFGNCDVKQVVDKYLS